MKGKVAPTKSTTKAYVSFCFPFPLLFRRLSTVFFIDSETNETIPLHFRNVFHFLARKTLRVKLFSLNVCEAALQAAIKGGNFGAKFTHLCGF